jgi:hypothetical protein
MEKEFSLVSPKKPPLAAENIENFFFTQTTEKVSLFSLES